MIESLIIASHNPGKVREIAALLGGIAREVRAAGTLGLAEPDETGASFQDNATLKARAAAEGAGLPALGDDSGLVVPALGGQPGLHSARWAGPARDFDHAMSRVERALAGVADRRAHFVCALALAWPDGRLVGVEGRVHGILVWPTRGTRDFGYDPIFRPDGQNLTFAEMAPEAKHRLSHRTAAFARLRARLCARNDC